MNHKLIGYYVIGIGALLLLVALVGGGVVLYKSVQENARLEMSVKATELNHKITEEILQEVHNESTDNAIRADKSEAKFNQVLRSSEYVQDWRNAPTPDAVSGWVCETYLIRQGKSPARAAEICGGTKTSLVTNGDIYFLWAETGEALETCLTLQDGVRKWDATPLDK